MKIAEWEPDSRIFLFYCPACETDHAVFTMHQNSRGAIWQWNGSFDKPSFTPSCISEGKNTSGLVVWRCHYRIINGQFHYYHDCSHQLAGKIVDMVDRK